MKNRKSRTRWESNPQTATNINLYTLSIINKIQTKTL